MAMNKDVKDSVYVQIPYCGFIPPLNVSGPLKSFVPKRNIVELVQRGYEVRILNPKACGDFAKQLDEYRFLIKNKRIQEAQQFSNTLLNIKQNPITSAIENASTKINDLTKSGQLPTTAIPGSQIDQAIANAKKTEALINSNLGQGDTTHKLSGQLDTIKNNMNQTEIPVDPAVQGAGVSITDEFQDEDDGNSSVPPIPGF